MPELPEVETAKRVTEGQIAGRTITAVRASRPDVIAHPDAEEFVRALPGRSICGMQRRGKFLRILLSDGWAITLHLRMTGCLLVAPREREELRHTHIVLELSGGMELRFSDMRRLGRWWLTAPGEADMSGMDALGPEPFDPCVTAEYLMERFGRSRRAVKTCLMDQSAVAGIGNIYSDELLFAARIRPDRPACSLAPDEWRAIAGVMPGEMQFFVDKSAISPEDYLAGDGVDYRNTPFLRVYGRAGQPCRVCGGALVRKVIGGRGSVHCPVCQQ